MRKRTFRGAHAWSVPAMAFCYRELCGPLPNRDEVVTIESSLLQNAATSTPQACAPRKTLALGAKHD
jgi:hypothetical protein